MFHDNFLKFITGLYVTVKIRSIQACVLPKKNSTPEAFESKLFECSEMLPKDAVSRSRQKSYRLFSWV